jgi:hypothetical protein
MAPRQFAAAACLPATTIYQSMFTVNDTNYDAANITGSFDGNQMLPDDQMWWENPLPTHGFKGCRKMKRHGSQFQIPAGGLCLLSSLAGAADLRRLKKRLRPTRPFHKKNARSPQRFSLNLA